MKQMLPKPFCAGICGAAISNCKGLGSITKMVIPAFPHPAQGKELFWKHWRRDKEKLQTDKEFKDLL